MTSVRRIVGFLALLVLLPASGAWANQRALGTDMHGDSRSCHLSVGVRGNAVVVSLDGSTSAVATLYTRAAITRVLVTDINHDGQPDIVAATTSGVHLWINNGHGQFVRRKPRHRRTNVFELPAAFRSTNDASGTIEPVAPHAFIDADDSGQHAPRGPPLQPTTIESFAQRLSVASVSLRGPPSFRSSRS